MRAAIYLRVSTDDQAERYGLAAQQKACAAFADARGWPIVRVYADAGVTGQTDERPQLEQAIRDAKAGFFERLILYDHTRLGRRSAVSAKIRDELDQAGVQIAYVSVGDVEAGSDAGVILDPVLDALSELEIRHIVKRTKAGRRQSAKSGNVLVPCDPYGYRKVKRGDKTTLEIKPDEAAIVRRIFHAYTNGSTISAIVRELGAMGAKKPNGRPFNRNNVRDILQRETYVGRWVYGKTRVVSRGGRRVKVLRTPREHQIIVDVPAIIDEATWEKAQELVRASARERRGNIKYRYLMRGRVFCGECGGKYYCRTQTDRRGNVYHYYHHYTDCRTPASMRADKIDPLVKDWLIELLSDPSFVYDEIEREQAMAEARRAQHAEDIERLTEKLATLDAEEQRVKLAYTRGLFSADDLAEHLDRITQERHTCEAQLADLQREAGPANEQVDDYVRYLESLTMEEVIEEIEDFDLLVSKLGLRLIVHDNGQVEIKADIELDSQESFRDRQFQLTIGRLALAA